MMPPFVRNILLAIAGVVMVSAVIWIGHLMFADLSKLIDNNKKGDHDE